MTTTSIGSGAWREAAQKAQAIVAGLDADLLWELAGDDPGRAIETRFGLTVELRYGFTPRRTTSVVGQYFPDEGRIVIERALSVPRMRFTALHELAHHLITTRHEELALELMGPPRATALEEAICDSFAGGVLIPSETVDEVIGEEGPDAEAVITLYKRTNASRAAAAVRAAERLGASGHVMIADLDGVTQFTATRGIKYIVAPGSQQSEGIVTKAAARGRASGTGKVTYRTGLPSEEFYADARRDGDYVFAVFTAGNASWVDLHMRQEYKASPREALCESCGESFTYWKTHAECGVPKCPHCQVCGCSPAVTLATTICSECFCRILAHRVVDGVCNDCRGA